MLHRHLGSFLALCLGPAAMALGAGGNLQPLVTVQDRHTTAAGPAYVAFVDQDLFVSRGGDVELISINRALFASTPFATTLARGVAPPAAFAALNLALSQAHPAAFSGECFAELFPLGSSFRITLAWFGRGTRSGSVTLTSDGPVTGGSCAPEVLAVLQAAWALEQATLADTGTALESSVCANDAQCPAGLKCCYPCGIPGCENRCSRPASDGNCPLLP